MKLGLVRPTEQLKGQRLCFVIFAICLSARFIEYFLIETDKRAIGENVFHKIFGIVILAAALKVTDIKWRDIGFQRDGSVSGIFEGYAAGKRLLLPFVWAGVGASDSARRPRAFGAVYQRLLVDRFSDKKYWLRFLRAVRSVQCYQCMDGGGRFSRTVYPNALCCKAVYGSEYDCCVFIWRLAHSHAAQKLYER